MTQENDRRLKDLLAKQEIHDCLMRYCRAIDRCDEELLRTVYHPGATDDHGSFTGTAEGFIIWVMKGLRERFRLTTHSVSNMLIEVEDDVAFAESYVNAMHIHEEDGIEWEWTFCGRYVDRFECRGDAWKIAKRVAVFDWESRRPADPHKVLRPGEYQNVGLRSRNDMTYRIREGATGLPDRPSP